MKGEGARSSGLSPRLFVHLVLVVAFLTAYCVQPLLVDVIKFNGGANASTFSILVPHYLSMVMVGLLPTKQSLGECDWRKGLVVSLLDIVNQLLKKAGLIYAGAAVYIVVDSSSLVWTAVWSRLILNRRLTAAQWLGIFVISLGVSLKACQLNLAFSDEEFVGVLLILSASILMGLTFVLNEKFMCGGSRVEGPNLVCMMGICSGAVICVWSLLWTVPQFEEVVVQPIVNKGGSLHTVASCSLWLFISGWIHSGTLWYLMANFGAVSTGILKGLKVALVFVISHFLFCKFQPSQCLNAWTAASAATCVFGVILYSLATPAKGKRETEKLLAKEEAVCSPSSSTREATPVSDDSAIASVSFEGAGVRQRLPVL
ncbi:hypothetical protein Efla_004536 [Eimeria flavescens]